MSLYEYRIVFKNGAERRFQAEKHQDDGQTLILQASVRDEIPFSLDEVERSTLGSFALSPTNSTWKTIATWRFLPMTTCGLMTLSSSTLTEKRCFASKNPKLVAWALWSM